METIVEGGIGGAQGIVKKRTPPRIDGIVGSVVQRAAAANQKPRRRRIRSELDRLLRYGVVGVIIVYGMFFLTVLVCLLLWRFSDEGTRNMLRGLKIPSKKPSTGVFRTRVIVGGEKGGGRGAQGAAGRRVFKRVGVVRRRRGSSVGRGRSSSPGKSRESVKIDYKYVSVVKRSGVGFVTLVNGDGGGVKCEEGEGEGGCVGEGIVCNSVLGGWGVKVLQSIDSAIRTLEQETLISVIVLQNSHSRFFCNGIDLSELVGVGKGNVPGVASRISAVVKAMKSLISTLNSSRKLLVASVSGDCVGFGVMVLPLFDLVYANDKSSFRVHYNALGQSPEGVGLMGALLRGGGAGKLTSLLYLNTSLTATEALQAGLVHEILWPARYQEELAVRLQSLSSQGNLICASKSTIRGYRRNVKVTDLNSEFSTLEEQWGSQQFQDTARNVVLAGDYEFVFGKRPSHVPNGKG